MRSSVFLLSCIAFAATYSLHLQAYAAPAGPLIKHLSSLLKWTRSASKPFQTDGHVLRFENGYLVETVVEGNDIGVVPYQIRVSEDGELYAVDSVNSNIVKITPPLSQYSRARLVAGSFQGYTGHVDGKPNEARFNHPKSVTMDDRGNVYVADTLNLAIRKISDSGVTTIAGGKSNMAGYRDGPSEDAKFSNDFDVLYIRHTCSLMVIDRGNAALRQISLNQDDCDFESSSISSTDILMVIGAVIFGYATFMLQLGFGSSFSTKQQHSLESELKDQPMKQKFTSVVDTTKEEPGWPSFGQLLIDLSKLALEATASIFLSFVPARFRTDSPRKGLTPLKDRLKMPEDEPSSPRALRQNTPTPLVEARRVHSPNGSEKFSETKPLKLKSSSFKDPSLSNKHRTSKRQEYAEFYGPSEVPPHSRSKSQKERPRHRPREKSGEAAAFGSEQQAKPPEMKQADYENPRYEQYNMRNRYGSNAPFHF